MSSHSASSLGLTSCKFIGCPAFFLLREQLQQFPLRASSQEPSREDSPEHPAQLLYLALTTRWCSRCQTLQTRTCGQRFPTACASVASLQVSSQVPQLSVQFFNDADQLRVLHDLVQLLNRAALQQLGESHVSQELPYNVLVVMLFPVGNSREDSEVVGLSSCCSL